MVETSEARLSDDVRVRFEELYGCLPEAVAWAPGRVNLLGEHTDYNGGFVLPIPIAVGTAVAVASGGTPGVVEIASTDFDGVSVRNLSEGATGDWSDYVFGSVLAHARELAAESGLRVLATSDLPVGSGLSSSAAIEVATLRALGSVTGVTMSKEEIAVAARKVENSFVGMPCGIMDQFAISVGTPGEALFLNTRTLEHVEAPLLPGCSFVIIHSGVTHKLAESGYSTRVAECRAACDALGVDMLSNLSVADLPRIAAIEDVLARRARHIVTDNRLTLEGVEALKAGDAERFGKLMIESHASERDDYQITVAETDAMVIFAVELGALGARQTGGGFGGSIVVLTRDQDAERIGRTVVENFPLARVLAIT